jgi:hypothetical protein
VAGSATYDYQTSNGSILFSNMDAVGTETLYLDGIEDGSHPLDLATSSEYTCSGNSLRIFNTAGTATSELTRTG